MFRLLLTTILLTIPMLMIAQNIYQIPVDDIEGNNTTLEDFKGKVMLIVNVASKCGLTPQYEDLQALYEEYEDEGLVILGFPANNFMSQEPGSNEEILEFCTSNFGVTFPMFSKIDVKGRNMHPLYEYLTSESLNGKMDSKVSWNFQKYLIDRNGELVEVISPRERVNEEEVRTEITSLL
jgi:glutathione peroxidase